MKTTSILCLLAALLLFALPVPAWAEGAAPEAAWAEAAEDDSARSIYVGDIITLEIAAGGISAEQLRERFKEFEIVALEQKSGVYSLSVRSFEPGEYSVLLGDKELVITVGSTLIDIEREDIFEGGASILEPGFAFYWRAVFIVAAVVFALSGGAVLLKIVLKKREEAPSPYLLFLRRTGGLSVDDESCFVELTRCFKEYIEGSYSRRLIGKTSVEIMRELETIAPLEDMLPAIWEWLVECDAMKFSGIRAAAEKRQEHFSKMLGMVKRIDLQKTETQKEGVV